MKIETLSNGTRIVKRYRKGNCYACAWSADSSDKKIKHGMLMGDAAFFPYNEANGEFLFHLVNRPISFRK